MMLGSIGIRTLRNNRLLTFKQTLARFSKWHNKDNGNNDILKTLQSLQFENLKEPKFYKNNSKVFNSPKKEYKVNHKKQTGKNSSKEWRGKRQKTLMWISGNPKQQEVASAMAARIIELNIGGKMKLLDPLSGSISMTSIFQFCKEVDLDKYGLDIVNVEKKSDELTIPLIKLISPKIAQKNYSDALAEQRRKELGFEEQKKSKKSNDKKFVRISWEISNEDLRKQKTTEILKLFEKDNTVELLIGKKQDFKNDFISSFENLNQKISAKSQKKLSESEEEKRLNLLDYIEKLLVRKNIQSTTMGSIHSKIAITCKPAIVRGSDLTENSNTDEKRELKKQKKLERQEKLAKRTAKRQERFQNNF